MQDLYKLIVFIEENSQSEVSFMSSSSLLIAVATGGRHLPPFLRGVPGEVGSYRRVVGGAGGCLRCAPGDVMESRRPVGGEKTFCLLAARPAWGELTPSLAAGATWGQGNSPLRYVSVAVFQLQAIV